MSNKAISALLLLGLIALSSECAFAGQAIWTSAGPYGNPGAVLFHPKTNNLVFSSTGQGFFSSTDAGQTWTAQNLSFFVDIFRIPSKPPFDIVAATTEYGPALLISKSSDLGHTWQRISNTSIPIGDSAFISDFEISPVNPQIIYASISTYGLLKSTNGGKNWTRILNFSPRLDAKIEIGTNNVIYLLQDDARTGLTVAKSLNGGKSWISINNGLKLNPGLMILEVDPNNPNVVYVGTNVVFKSVNAGASWARLSLPQLTFYDFKIDPKNSNNLMAASSGPAFRSFDAGKTWMRVFWPRKNHPISVAFDPFASLILASGDDLLRSTDFGKTWKPSSTGVNELTIWSLNSNIGAGPQLLAMDNDTLFQSIDEGEHWRFLYRSSGSVSVPVAKSHPSNASIIGVNLGYAIPSFVLTTNGGKNWTALSIFDYDFCFHAQDQNVIYFPHGKSTDQGKTFQPYSLKFGPHENTVSIRSDLTNGDTLYLLTNKTAYKSLDRGSSWKKLSLNAPPGQYFTGLELAPSNQNILYVTASNGVWRSVDGGMNWTHPNRAGGIGSFAIDPENPETLYWANQVDIWVSTDGAATSTIFDRTGLPKRFIVAFLTLAVEGTNPKTIHVGSDLGVFSYTLN